MKQTHSPAQKRLETLQMFYKYCSETYKDKLAGNGKGDDLLWQVCNIIYLKIHKRDYFETVYGTKWSRNVCLEILKDFIYFNKLYNYCEVSWEIRQTSIWNFCETAWEIRKASMAIIKLINEKL